MKDLKYVKIIYTIFMIVMIPVYLFMYGPTNFLYICDCALILTLIGLLFNKPLLISMGAVGIILPQTLWLLDFFGTLLGLEMTGLTAYMFNSDTSIFLRGLSLFHGWLPILLVYLVSKTGYDPKAFKYWTILFWCLMIISILAIPSPEDNGLTPNNINFVWGIRDGHPQTWVPRIYWIILLMIGMPILLFYPTHLVLKKLFPQSS